MKKVKEFRVSLMEKEKDFSIDEEGRGNYIIRASGTFNVQEYFRDKGEIDSEEERSFIESAIVAIYNQLPKEASYETLGLWITYEDGKIIDNSMDISVLESMKELGDNVDPVWEFAKMTLDAAEYESEVSK